MSTNDYDKQISIRDDGVYVGDVKVPGNVDAEFEVGRSVEIPDHWMVRLTLTSYLKPKFELEEFQADPIGMETTTYRHRAIRHTATEECGRE